MTMGSRGTAMDGGIQTIPAAPSHALVPASVPLPPAFARRRRRSRGVALLAALLLGWAALFSYSIAYLSNDGPGRAITTVDVGPAASGDPAAFQAAAELAARPAPPVAGAETRTEPEPEPAPAAEADLHSGPVDPRAAAEIRAEQPSVKPPAEGQPAGPGAAPAIANRPEFVGTWGPTGAACGTRARRRGYIPATITLTGARAGQTVCSFHNGRRSGNAWQMAADCSEGDRRWSSQVRLVVDGNRLTWSSAKGSSTYVRCGRRRG